MYLYLCISSCCKGLKYWAIIFSISHCLTGKLLLIEQGCTANGENSVEHYFSSKQGTLLLAHIDRIFKLIHKQCDIQ